MVPRDGPERRAAPRSMSLSLAMLLAAATPPALSQTYTDVIAREFTVVRVSPESDTLAREFTVVNAHDIDAPDDAVTRELTVVNASGIESQVDAVAREFTAVQTVDLLSPDESITREISAFNALIILEATSTGVAHAKPIAGTLPEQLAALNAIPPVFDPNAWLPVHRQNLNVDDQFLCGSVPDPLARGYLSADAYLDDFGVAADEVTFNNCGSAFYRFTFVLPDDVVLSTVSLTGSANVDDQGVVWLNSTRLSALMTAPSCIPTNPSDPLDPCYLQQDAGRDRTDAQGRRVLTWPTLDPFGTSVASAFVPGENTLIFAVAGDAQAFEPTGVEFAAAVLYFKRGDIDCSGQVDFLDIDPFVTALGGSSAYGSVYPHCRWLTADMDCDGDVDFSDIDPFVACLSGDCACP